MSDTIVTLGHSVVQHGPFNNRLYVMKLDPQDLPGLIDQLAALADKHAYTKIVAKGPAQIEQAFVKHGYSVEATIPGFFNGIEPAAFFSKFLDETRAIAADQDVINQNLALARQRMGESLSPSQRDPERDCSVCPADVEAISEVYAEVFPTYPFPIHDPAYLLETMQKDHNRYFCIREDGRIVAVASAEMDAAHGNVEMTDFATLPPYRGRGYAVLLLDRMEHEMKRDGFQTAYTIARAASAGMNITFARLGYTFSGTLINNTNIAGQIESMNIWYKPLRV